VKSSTVGLAEPAEGRDSVQKYQDAGRDRNDGQKATLEVVVGSRKA
jgi:hypothetical protein